MTGRLHVAAELVDFIELFGVSGELAGMHPMPPRHNVAPTEPVLTIIDEYGRRTARLMKWAFVPDWVKDPREFSQITSARRETVETKPSFKNAIRYRRCLVPVTGFYEWQRHVTGETTPYFFQNEDKGLFALAGIWESWMGPNGEEFDGLAILTTPAPRAFKPVTDRLPLIIAPDGYGCWLNTSSGRFEDARPLLSSSADRQLIAFPISDRVNQRRNDDPSLTEPRDGQRQTVALCQTLDADGGKAGKRRNAVADREENKAKAPEQSDQFDLF
nr:SOS response-associated peptidase [uncultured Cohaesibacter sp.]